MADLEGKGQQEHWIVDRLGDDSLLRLPKTAFLCSREIPASAVLRCYDWAIRQRELGRCVLGGFHSPIEKDVLHYLLAGRQPVILALARGMKRNLETPLRRAVDCGQLLIVTPFAPTVRGATRDTAAIRNRLMIELADEVTVGYADPRGMIESLIRRYAPMKPFHQL